jgi:hypothetical protein
LLAPSNVRVELLDKMGAVLVHLAVDMSKAPIVLAFAGDNSGVGVRAAGSVMLAFKPTNPQVRCRTGGGGVVNCPPNAINRLSATCAPLGVSTSGRAWRNCVYLLVRWPNCTRGCQCASCQSCLSCVRLIRRSHLAFEVRS